MQRHARVKTRPKNWNVVRSWAGDLGDVPSRILRLREFTLHLAGLITIAAGRPQLRLPAARSKVRSPGRSSHSLSRLSEAKLREHRWPENSPSPLTHSSFHSSDITPSRPFTPRTPRPPSSRNLLSSSAFDFALGTQPDCLHQTAQLEGFRRKAREMRPGHKVAMECDGGENGSTTMKHKGQRPHVCCVRKPVRDPAGWHEMSSTWNEGWENGRTPRKAGPRWSSGWSARLRPRRSRFDSWGSRSTDLRMWESCRDDAARRRVFSGISRFLHTPFPALLHIHIIHPSSALKTIENRPNLSIQPEKSRQIIASSRYDSHIRKSGAAVVQRLLGRSPPTKSFRVRSQAWSLPDFRMWELCMDDSQTTVFARKTNPDYLAVPPHSRQSNAPLLFQELWTSKTAKGLLPRLAQRNIGLTTRAMLEPFVFTKPGPVMGREWLGSGATSGPAMVPGACQLLTNCLSAWHPTANHQWAKYDLLHGHITTKCNTKKVAPLPTKLDTRSTSARTRVPLLRKSWEEEDLDEGKGRTTAVEGGRKRKSGTREKLLLQSEPSHSIPEVQRCAPLDKLPAREKLREECNRLRTASSCRTSSSSLRAAASICCYTSAAAFFGADRRYPRWIGSRNHSPKGSGEGLGRNQPWHLFGTHPSIPENHGKPKSGWPDRESNSESSRMRVHNSNAAFTSRHRPRICEELERYFRTLTALNGRQGGASTQCCGLAAQQRTTPRGFYGPAALMSGCANIFPDPRSNDPSSEPGSSLILVPTRHWNVVLSVGVFPNYICRRWLLISDRNFEPLISAVRNELHYDLQSSSELEWCNSFLRQSEIRSRIEFRTIIVQPGISLALEREKDLGRCEDQRLCVTHEIKETIPKMKKNLGLPFRLPTDLDVRTKRRRAVVYGRWEHEKSGAEWRSRGIPPRHAAQLHKFAFLETPLGDTFVAMSPSSLHCKCYARRGDEANDTRASVALAALLGRKIHQSVASDRERQNGMPSPLLPVLTYFPHSLSRLPPQQRLRTTAVEEGRGVVVLKLLASHLGETGSIPGGVAPGFSHVGIVPEDAGFSWGSPVPSALAFRRCYILTSLHPSSTLKTSIHGACIEPSYTLSTNKIIGSPLKVPEVHAARRDHFTPVQSLALSGDGDLMRVAVSPLTLPRLSASNAEIKKALGIRASYGRVHTCGRCGAAKASHEGLAYKYQYTRSCGAAAVYVRTCAHGLRINSAFLLVLTSVVKVNAVARSQTSHVTVSPRGYVYRMTRGSWRTTPSSALEQRTPSGGRNMTVIPLWARDQSSCGVTRVTALGGFLRMCIGQSKTIRQWHARVSSGETADTVFSSENTITAAIPLP
ncbi:hypothetical protein PR048_028034 [Dryococelus australis]|uniref:Uncharacterized protein n=1 Tax=Dryococelus australis TaxID=614101 RepID=A0ABQ9GI85_9NEOP|nr:hypothetical protein PR048_028034 [Dryococelus australis]